MKKVAFESEGIELVGNLFYPPEYSEGKPYPAVVVTGSWTTVKEQMAGLYAKRLSNKGYITLAFDFRGFGESGGRPRFYENPGMKVEDIKNAVGFLASLPEVDAQKIGLLGICAGAGYSLVAASGDKRVKAVVTVASWLHDAEAVKLFYGGEAGVEMRLKAAQNARKRYEQSGETDYVPTISTTDGSAAMFGEYDYYQPRPRRDRGVEQREVRDHVLGTVADVRSDEIGAETDRADPDDPLRRRRAARLYEKVFRRHRHR